MKLLNDTKDAARLWRQVAEKHAAQPYHLLMMGGDQLYCDAMWDKLVPLQEWASLPLNQRVKQRLLRKCATWWISSTLYIGRIWANGYVETEPYPFTKVIHPIDFRMPAPIVPRKLEAVTSVMEIRE